MNLDLVILTVESVECLYCSKFLSLLSSWDLGLTRIRRGLWMCATLSGENLLSSSASNGDSLPISLFSVHPERVESASNYYFSEQIHYSRLCVVFSAYRCYFSSLHMWMRRVASFGATSVCETAGFCKSNSQNRAMRFVQPLHRVRAY